MRFLVLGLLAIVPVILADAPTPTIQDLVKEGQDKFDKALSEIKKNIGLSDKPTGDEIIKVIKDKNDELAKEVKGWSKKLEEQIKNNPDASAALNNVKTKLKEAGDKLKKENPEIAKNAEKLGESVRATWESIIKEVEKSHNEFAKKGGKQDEIEKFFKNIIDQGAKAANDLKDNIDKAVNKKN